MEKRKHPRLKNFDYSENGYYFVTICTAEHKKILSSINVGRGKLPSARGDVRRTEGTAFVKGSPAEVILTPIGKIAKEQILSLESRYPYVKIEKYVIMPNHIHLLVFIDGFSAGASPRPTLSDIICSFKSLTTKNCKQQFPCKTLWQTSFYDHVIRNEKDYIKHYNYIETNPLLWEREKDEH